MNHPVTAIEGLRQYLPRFILDLGRQDVEDYIIEGFVTRRFRIRGRFSPVGYTRAMRNAEDFTISAFLKDKIPLEGPNIIYSGDAMAILVGNEPKLLRGEDETLLTDIPDYSDITFIYNRPSPMQLWLHCQDILFHVQYDDEFDDDQDQKHFVNQKRGAPKILEDQSFLRTIIKPFKNAVSRQSRFGYSSKSVHTMLGLALAYRAADMFFEAEGTLDEAFKISEKLSNEDLITHVLFNFIELYLDQGFLEKTNEKFAILKSKSFRKKSTDFNALEDGTAHNGKWSLRLEEELISDCFGHFVIKYALKLFKQGFIQQAVTLIEKITQSQELRNLELCSSKSHQEDTVSSGTEVVGALPHQKEYCLAEKFSWSLMEKSRRNLDTENPMISLSMENLATVLSDQGKYDEAEMMHREALRLREKVLGPEHSDTLTSINNLALTLSDQGKYNEAEVMHREALRRREKVLGPEHSDTLTSINNLALTLSDQGKYNEAEVMHREALRRREKVLGPEHSDTLTSINNLALTLSDQGKYNEAEVMHREALRLREKVLGREDSDTLTGMANLASTFWNQGRLREAEKLEVHVMETRKRMLGLEHPDTLTSMANLASTFWNEGRWQEAEKLEVQVMGTRKRMLGPDHPDTLTSMANLASTYQNQGRWKEAEELELKVLETRKKVLGEEHPDTLTSITNLAWTYRSQGRWKEAEELFIQATEASLRVLGEEHPKTLMSMANLASTYQNQGRWNEAEELELKVLEMRKKVLGDRHPHTLISMANLAYMRKDQNRDNQLLS